MKSTRKMTKALLWAILIPLVTFAPVTHAVAQTCVQPPAGLVSWWPGDGNASDIQDANDGTLQNGATFDTGFIGQAFSLDGVDDHVQVPNSNTLKLVQQVTVDAWVKFTAGTNLGNGTNWVVVKKAVFPLPTSGRSGTGGKGRKCNIFRS
ncbi:MAG: hypothetical protein ACE5Q3_16580 [Alphaproteobacteria bacterium]